MTDHSETIVRYDAPRRPDGTRRVPEIHATVTFTWDNPDVVVKYLGIDHQMFVTVPWETEPGMVRDTRILELPPLYEGKIRKELFRFPLMPFTTYAGAYTITGAGDPKTGTAGPLSTGPAAPF